MKQKMYVVTEVDISEGSTYVPTVRGIYQTYTAAKDNAVVLLCGKAAYHDIPESQVDANALHLSNDSGTIAFQFGITEVEMEIVPVFKVR